MIQFNMEPKKTTKEEPIIPEAHQVCARPATNGGKPVEFKSIPYDCYPWPLIETDIIHVTVWMEVLLTDIYLYWTVDNS